METPITDEKIGEQVVGKQFRAKAKQYDMNNR